MNAKQYLRQAYRLDQKINSDLAELSRLREMAASIGSPDFEEHYNPNCPTEAPFVKALEKVWEMQEKIRMTIDKVENPDEQMVLRYRYIHNYTWEQIGDALYADESTIRRWHGRALQHIEVPENHITI